jgi:hypothetical protein
MGDNIISTLSEAVKNALGGFAQFGAPASEKPIVGEAAKYTRIPAPETTTHFLTVDELYDSIRQNATMQDPTASAGALSPLTNNSVASVANLGYTSGNWIADFAGAGGQPAGISYEYDKTTGGFYTVDSRTKNQVVIMGDPNNPSQYQKLDYTTALNMILTPYRAQPGGIDALKQQLVARGALTVGQAKKSIGEDKVLIGALIKVVDEMSRSNFLSGTKNATFYPFKSFLTGTAADSKAGTTTSTGYYTNLTNEKAATDEISIFIKQYLNRGATASEIDAYKKALDKFEREHPEKIVATVTTDASGTEKTRKQTRTSGGASDADKQAIMTSIMTDSLAKNGYNIDQISQTGGLLARGIDAIKKQASNYGVLVDNSAALNAVFDALKPGGSIDTENEKIKQKAKLQYKNLSSAIDAGLTVKDIADQYNEYKKKYLETITPTDVFDPDIQKALNNNGKNQIMNLNDWTVLLKNKPEWPMTMNAREEASSWLNSLLKEFGEMQ